MVTINNFLQFGKPSKRQLNTIDLFNVVDFLYQKGFEDITEESIESTLIDESANKKFCRDSNYEPDRAIFIDFIEKFKKKSFRLAVRNEIFDKSFSAISNSDYSFTSSRDNEKRYSNTVELLIAYLCVKELRALSASFGIKIKNSPDGGDFDCIANFQNSLFHFEIKSGDIKNLKKDILMKFLKRHRFLSPNASILFLDYEGKSSLPMDDFVLKFKDIKIGGLQTVSSIHKISKDGKRFYMIDGDIMVVDLYHRGEILPNLRAAMQYFHKYNSHIRTMASQIIKPEHIGYVSEELFTVN